MPRVAKPTQDTHIRLPLELYQHLVALSEEAGRSIQEEIMLRLQHSTDTVSKLSFGWHAEPRKRK